MRSTLCRLLRDSVGGTLLPAFAPQLIDVCFLQQAQGFPFKDYNPKTMGLLEEESFHFSFKETTTTNVALEFKLSLSVLHRVAASLLLFAECLFSLPMLAAWLDSQHLELCI